MKLKKNDVVQFNENHKWCGCLGIVREVRYCDNDIRYMVYITIPKQGTAFIYVMKSENALDLIGHTDLILKEME